MSRVKLWTTKFLKISIIFLIIFGWIFSGFPPIWQNPPFPPGIQVAQAAMPTFQAKGSFTSGVGALSVPVPTGYQDDDVFLLFVESANQAIATPTEWTEVANSPQFEISLL